MSLLSLLFKGGGTAAATPVFKLEIAFGTSNPLTASPIYTDVTADLISATVSRGRQRELDQCQAGTATITLDNLNWQYLPGYASGANYPNVLPGKWIRLSATVGATTYRLFTGLIDRWEASWDDPGYSTVTVQATDALALLQLLPIQGPLIQEKTGARITDILTLAGWVGATSIATGVRTVPVKTFVLTDNQTAGAAINQTVDSEPGTFFAAGDGTLTFYSAFTGGGGMPASLGDRPDLGEIALDGATLTLPNDTTFNDLRGTRDGGTGEQQQTDTTSISEFAKRLATKSTYSINDADLVTVLASFLSRYKYPTQIFDPVMVNPVGDLNSAYAWCCQAEITKTVTVLRTPPPASGLPRFSQSCVINWLQHDIKPGGNGGVWTTTLRLAGAALH